MSVLLFAGDMPVSSESIVEAEDGYVLSPRACRKLLVSPAMTESMIGIYQDIDDDDSGYVSFMDGKQGTV